MANINAPIAIATKQVTISSVAKDLTALPVSPFTAAQVLAAARAVVSVRSNSVNVRWDGTSPTVAIGHPFTFYDVFQILGNENIKLFEIIRNGATDADVTITLEA